MQLFTVLPPNACMWAHFGTLRKYILVQSFYGLTFNKLQHKCFQVFLVQKNELYNISKVSLNLMGGKHRN